MSTSGVIAVSSLSHNIGERQVLKDVSFTINRGEFVVIVGENGAGKSSLVAALAGVLKPAQGSVLIDGEPPTVAYRAGRLAAVWQESAVCDDMTVEDNLFLGRELGGFFLQRRRMRARAAEVLTGAGLAREDGQRRVSELSGGQRQLLALAAALMRQPEVLILDEPTTALGVAAQSQFDNLLRRLRSQGVTVILISHRVEQVMALADRVLALRQGELVADSTTVELTTDDIVALMSGLASGLTAKRHLTQLSDLVDQLADVEPAASIPLIVSAIANTLGQQQLCVHLRDPHEPDHLRVGASVGLSAERLARFADVVSSDDSTIARAYASGEVQVRENLTDLERSDAAEPVSIWSVPILGNGEVYGVVSGLADVPGRPQSNQLEVVSLYASLAATSIERELLLRQATRNNRMLESLRQVLDALTGSVDRQSAFASALTQLRRELAASRVTLARVEQDGSVRRVHVDPADSLDLLGHDAISALDLATAPSGVPFAVTANAIAVATTADVDQLILLAEWPAPVDLDDRGDLMQNAAWSITLSVEREKAQDALAEARASTRTSELQREFVHRLSHELRTPLTAIVGYASTLKQPDIDWEPSMQRHFVEVISAESARMHRLVRDLLDSSTLSAGRMPIVPDWCDLALIVSAAVDAAGCPAGSVTVSLDDLPPVWADHDRIEQVFINLLDNSFRHGASMVEIFGAIVSSGSTESVVIDVTDDGPGVGARGPSLELFEPYIHGDTSSPGLGLGLSISRGIVEAHCGEIEFVTRAGGADVRLTIPTDFTVAEASGARA